MINFKNIPAFKFAVLFSAGILLGAYFYFNQFVLIILIFALIILQIFLFRKSGEEKINYEIIFILVILFGIFKANIDFRIKRDTDLNSISKKLESHYVNLTGVIKEFPDYDTASIKLILDAENIITESDSINTDGLVYVRIKKNNYYNQNVPQSKLEAGDRIKLFGSLSEPSENRNPGDFNFRKYLALQDIYNSFFVLGYDNVGIISKNNSSFFNEKIIYPVKKFTLKNFDEYIKDIDSRAYLKGLVAGERSDISSEMKTDFVNAGVMHLIAVSGLNVTYVILAVTLLLSLLRIPRTPRLIITIIFIIAYCLFTGSTASVMRASAMGILFLISFHIERKRNFYNIVGLSAIIILMINSKQLFDAGFILSFSAVLSMVFKYETFKSNFFDKIQDKFKGKKRYLYYLINVILLTTAAQIGTLPLTAIYFEKISIVSFILNVVIIPISNISLAVGFLQIIAASVSELLSSIIAAANNFLLFIQMEMIKLSANLKFAYFEFYGMTIPRLIAYYLVIILLVTATLKKIKFRIALSGLIIFFIIVSSINFSNKLRITFLDVGQAECSLIQLPDGKNILVDCGTSYGRTDREENKILPFLKRQGIDKIDLLIFTHLHADHIAGAKTILNNIECAKIIDAGQISKSSIALTIDSIISVKKIIKEKVRRGDLIEGKDYRIYFLFPEDDEIVKQNKGFTTNLNNTSIVFKLKYKYNDILFTGDMEETEEIILSHSYKGFLDCNLIKVPHHGSRTSSSFPFLLKVKPEFAVFSCGLFNMYKNPNSLVLNRYKNINSTIFRTDRDGAVVFESDGNNIYPVDWR